MPSVITEVKSSLPAMLTGMKASVLMTVYAGDDPNHFATALRSLLQQTRMPDEIILVEDGPLTAELRQQLNNIESDTDVLCRVPLPENIGLIGALNEGLRHCRGELIFRMDADDISQPDRLESQIAYLDANQDIGVVGSNIRQFEDDEDRDHGLVKRMPEHHEAIVRALPWRNPVNHPTVCMRREVIKRYEYPALRYVEDYFLWAKLIADGVKFHNLQQPLVAYRFDGRTLHRRSGWLNFRNEMALRTWMRREGMMSMPFWLVTGLVQFIVRFSPSMVQGLLWRVTRSGATRSGATRSGVTPPR